jgi:hypothetical protein
MQTQQTMKTKVRIGLVLAAVFGLSIPGFGQGSMFFFTSSPQSIIGQGETFTASSTNGFTISAQRNVDNGVSVIISSETRYWFRAPRPSPSVNITMRRSGLTRPRSAPACCFPAKADPSAA